MAGTAEARKETPEERRQRELLEQQQRETLKRYNTAKEKAPEMIELIREGYNLGMVDGARSLIAFHVHHKPPYGIAARRPFTADDYDPYYLSPYAVKITGALTKKQATIKEIKANKKNAHRYYSKQTISARASGCSVQMEVWECRRCKMTFENIPPKHKCYAVD